MQISNISILYVMASRSEYGPCLQSKISPLMLGIGPVEASINLTAELGKRYHDKSLPDLVVSLGSAGSRVLPEKEVFQVTAVSYRDMDVSLLGYEKGCTPLLDLPASVPLPHTIHGIPGATLSTGASIISGDAYNAIDADMVDMETFAILRACQKFSIPMIGFRGISDGVKELGQLSDWEQYLHVIDEKLSRTVDQLHFALNNGLLHPPKA
jgi:adenosylhomocysteine nucleosidase